MSGIFSTIRRAAGSGYGNAEAQGNAVASGGEDMRFTIQPGPGESGFSQWAAAMKMVAQLPGGIPPEFRRRLWLTLAERHLDAQGVDWTKVERNCFSEWSHPADSELGVQIVKDLHRTGCSLFCGEDGQENQALLKRVLLAYARWNKAVGYCQGFNMLAALILQVTEKCETEALKLMIYLIEGVLPESYFADSLRGLSVDMAVFRELLRSKLPRLSRHLDTLQTAAKDGNTSYEPPLTNVFTMQWFLTLFCNCLPQPTVLRVWDLILLEGNEILLRTALAIWQTLADRIMGVRSADEFYCIMGVLTRELLESGLLDANSLIKAVVNIGPLTELNSLRDHYMYNINPWGGLQQAVVEKQLKLYPRERLALDISALKKQYTKLKQRQRQAHIIFSAAISRQPTTAAPVAMNHLLIGKSALVPAKRLGPPKGTIPPARQITPTTLHWKDTRKNDDSSDSSDTELCDDDASDHSDIEESGQFDDNLSNSDTNLMNTDNTSAKISASKIEEPQSQITVEEATSSSTVIPIKVEAVDSDDDNIEFEKFLADRVKCLKQHSLPEEDEVSSEEEKSRSGRRNSERALQIIQENSLILTRILQCQSRLSPSPPLIDDTPLSRTEPPDFLDLSFNKIPEEPQEFEYDIKSSLSEPEIKTSISPISPQYGNQYSSILEKSKSLDERYHSLILNQSHSKKSDDSDVIIEEKLIQFSPSKASTMVLNTEKSIDEPQVTPVVPPYSENSITEPLNISATTYFSPDEDPPKFTKNDDFLASSSSNDLKEMSQEATKSNYVDFDFKVSPRENSQSYTLNKDNKTINENVETTACDLLKFSISDDFLVSSTSGDIEGMTLDNIKSPKVDFYKSTLENSRNNTDLPAFNQEDISNEITSPRIEPLNDLPVESNITSPISALINLNNSNEYLTPKQTSEKSSTRSELLKFDISSLSYKPEFFKQNTEDKSPTPEYKFDKSSDSTTDMGIPKLDFNLSSFSKLSKDSLSPNEVKDNETSPRTYEFKQFNFADSFKTNDNIPDDRLIEEIASKESIEGSKSVKILETASPEIKVQNDTFMAENNSLSTISLRDNSDAKLIEEIKQETQITDSTPTLSIEEIKLKYSKQKTEDTSFYEKSFSDDQKETFSRFSNLNYKKLYKVESPITELEENPVSESKIQDNIIYEAKTFDVSKYGIANKSPLNTKSILDEIKSADTESSLELGLRSDEDLAKTCYNYLKSPMRLKV